ncbi:MAG: hypothetical protein Q607_CBUC00146G0002 [Clostridium butyricum DORA_1]|nr:MAG: hypothetical protein Q607_CBUC00146G0002 [Clostridium butyricum DORA_1]
MERFVIAITRRAGSGGTTIGEMLADEFSINLYDKIPLMHIKIF